jgi:hypothetical protein
MSPSITGLAIGTLVRRLPMLPHVPDLALELPGLIPFFMTSQYIPAVQKSIVWFLFFQPTWQKQCTDFGSCIHI